MDSLELPQELIWDGNQSPILSHFSNASTEQILIFEDSFASEIEVVNDDLIKPNQTIQFSPEEFEQLLDIQVELLNTMAEDEQSDDQWLDQPINVPLDEYAPVQDACIHSVKGNTAQLLNEFNQVYDAVELTHLTPPETPPQTPPQTPLQAHLNDSKNQFYSQPITNYQLQPNQPYQQQCKPTDVKSFVNNSLPPPSTTQQFPSILEQAITLVQESNLCEYVENCDYEMAQVEALVRSRAEDFVPSSIDDDSSMCDSSTCFSPRSETSSSTTDDSDWTMQTSSAIAVAFKNKQTKQKRKPRINRRSIEDRQSRKKEQNKTAANRYRLKKKAEIEILLDEERELIKKNDGLKSQYKDVSREVKYIKSLLRELFKAKGLLD